MDHSEYILLQLTSWDLNPVALLRPRYELSFMPESNLTQDSHHLFESVSLTNFHHLGITLTFLRQKPQKVILGLNIPKTVIRKEHPFELCFSSIVVIC